MTMREITDIETEKRKGPKGSYNTNFAEVIVLDDGVRKQLSVYYNPHNKEYGLEVYQGYNYDIHSNDRSYSRHYKKFKGMPEKYKTIAYLLYARVPKGD